MNWRFVGVPDGIEEAFPDFLHVFFGDLGLGREPCMQEAEGFVSGGFVAGGQVPDSVKRHRWMDWTLWGLGRR